MKITELEKIVKLRETKIVNCNSTKATVMDASVFQEVSFRLCVSKTFWAYYTLAANLKEEKTAEKEKEFRSIYLCLARYALSLPDAFCFTSSNTEKIKAQNEAKEKLMAVCKMVAETAANIDVSNKELLIKAIASNCVALDNAFNEFRDTFLKIN